MSELCQFKPEPNRRPWRDLASAPKNATDVELCLSFKSGEKCIGHWAEDLSGDEQPPFRGWFTKCGSGFTGVKPIAWRPLA